MKQLKNRAVPKMTLLIILIIASALTYVISAIAKSSSYAPVVITEDFDSIMARMKAASFIGSTRIRGSWEWVSGLQQPGQRKQQPCVHTTARAPGPLA